MSVPEAIVELVEKFEANREDYASGNYNEARLRQEFLNPLFEALGWDMQNRQGYAEAYKDVVHEDAIKIGGDSRAPDYCFRIGGTRKFFVEAKKPAVNVREDISPAYQLRRYAWSAKLPLSILTDFDEFAVYDCRVKPVHTDKASTARTMYLTYKDYAAEWDKIASIFSRDAILKGSFDKYAESGRGKRGTAEVDAAFLKEIEAWRDVLARNLALRNANLTSRELNFAVQRIIDRIIFLRICEDRHYEDYGSLRALLNGTRVYPRLTEMFRAADDRYNSGLFHFHRESARAEGPDELTLALELDDKPLKDIIKNLYYPDSPYEFSVLPADILGQVYEQFLGKVIRLTPGHQAKVEDKPEVKKAGGVYYTPTYIVDYIVRNTVGKLVEGKTPKQVEKLRVLDPACGSGSFLIGAYQFLLDWHCKWYTDNDPAKWVKGRNARLYQAERGEWRLTNAERKRILLANIYGVDIDSQAVEVTKLSLLLKILEGGAQLAMGGERMLPDLGENIKCGNSLIGPDFYSGQQMTLMDDEERLRINVFDWDSEFPEIMKSGGFDAVIGNPPYVRPHNLEPEAKGYFWQHYSTFVKKSDLYCCFVERALFVLRREGEFGYIISNGWLRLDSFEKLRETLLDRTNIHRIVDFEGNVFANASVRTAILLLRKGGDCCGDVQIATCKAGTDLARLSFRHVEQSTFRSLYKSIFDLSMDGTRERVKRKIESAGLPLGDTFELAFGLKTGDDSMFLTSQPTTPEHKPLLRGEDVHRYALRFKGEYVWYVPHEMTKHRRTARPGNRDRFEQPKLMIRDTGGSLEGTLDEQNHYAKDVLIVTDQQHDVRRLTHLLGLLNSSALRFYYETAFPTLHVQRQELASLPIRQIDFSNSSDKARHDRMVGMVDQMLALHKQLADARLDQDKTAIQRQIDATDRQIDALVYDLYGLTDEEIAIVEGRQPRRKQIPRLRSE